MQAQLTRETENKAFQSTVVDSMDIEQPPPTQGEESEELVGKQEEAVWKREEDVKGGDVIPTVDASRCGDEAASHPGKLRPSLPRKLRRTPNLCPGVPPSF